MSIYDIAFAVIRVLTDLEIECVVVGGIATMYFGFARTTQDVDFVVAIDSQRRLSEVAARSTKHLRGVLQQAVSHD